MFIQRLNKTQKTPRAGIELEILSALDLNQAYVRPEPDPKSPAPLTSYKSDRADIFVLIFLVDAVQFPEKTIWWRQIEIELSHRRNQFS